MKRWTIWIALLYALTLIVLSFALVDLAFIAQKDPPKAVDLFGSWAYWLLIVILLLNQWALLALPVDVAHKRPSGKRSLVFQIVASAMSMGLLITGLVLGLCEVVNDSSLGYFAWIFFGALGILWVFWARVFATWSRKLGPGDLIRRTCHALFKGSVLQLLVLVPCHIYVRSRNECCAGFGTAIGLACGLAVMLVSFGPGIFFLYAEQLKKAKDGRLPADPEGAVPAAQVPGSIVPPACTANEGARSHAPGWRRGVGLLALWLLICWGALWLGSRNQTTEAVSFPLFSGSASPGKTLTASAPEPATASAPATVRTSAFRALTVSRKFNFVVVDGGLRDGLKMGARMKVLRGGQVIGGLQIEKLYDQFSAATLMEEDPQRPVVEGDEIRKA